MSNLLKIVGVHGLGDHRHSPWRQEWEAAVRGVFPDAGLNLQFDWISYDDIFADVDISLWQSIAALGKLAASGVDEFFGARRRGMLESVNHTLRWYAGYVVAWVENREFQDQTRARVIEKLEQFQPHVMLAHSLGSLVTYNALTHPDLAANSAAQAVANDLNYVTLGSQIGNAFVIRNLTPGRIEMPPVKKWYHLYNAEDNVFTAPIRLPGEPDFEQVDAFFDIEGFADHSATEYLTRPATIGRVWNTLATQSQAATSRVAMRAMSTPPPEVRPPEPRRLALLVGINDYPDPAARLDGCVNDVFLMSEVLQECNFSPDEIRLCLNDRATASGIRERLTWLVADAMPGDELVFFYSGHGAQLATYGDGDAVDHSDETLVPYDFDWTPEHSIVDDQIFNLYSQLPYDTRLVMIFDCCHSGGIHRSGSPKARGLEPPDDIRHRSLRWNRNEGMWEQRELQPLNAAFTDDPDVMRRYCGVLGNTRRLGRAMSLRALSQSDYQSLTNKRQTPVGPYLPLILEACQESELASEYRHGNESYGAFTYSIAKTLRTEGDITFTELVEKATSKLRRLNYDQTPQILGPDKIMSAKVPWLATARPAVAKAATRRKSKKVVKKKATKKRRSKKKKAKRRR